MKGIQNNTSINEIINIKGFDYIHFLSSCGNRDSINLDHFSVDNTINLSDINLYHPTNINVYFYPDYDRGEKAAFVYISTEEDNVLQINLRELDGEITSENFAGVDSSLIHFNVTIQ